MLVVKLVSQKMVSGFKLSSAYQERNHLKPQTSLAVVRGNHTDCGLIFLNEKINGSTKTDVVG